MIDDSGYCSVHESCLCECCRPNKSQPALNGGRKLTDEQCNEFRRLPLSINDMIRAIYDAGRKEQDKITRHACAEAMGKLSFCTTANDNAIYDSAGEIVDVVSVLSAHAACMNVKAV